MEYEDAEIGQTVYFVGDDYDKALKINSPVLMQGVITGVYSDSESIAVQWVENHIGEDDEQGDCFFFLTKEEAIADYISRHTEDLITQALRMDRETRKYKKGNTK